MFESPEAALAAFEQAMVSPGVLAGRRVAKEAREQFPDSVPVASILATALRATGEAEQAKAEIDRALALDRDDPSAIAVAINISCFEADFDRAESLVLRAKQGRLPLELLIAIGSYYSVIGQDELCHTWTMRALREHPMELDAHSSVVSRSGLPKGVIEQSLAWMRANYPNHPETLWLDGFAHYRVRDVANALPLMERSVEARPESPSIISFLSRVLYSKGETERAEILARRALDISRTQSEAWRVLADVARKKGDQGEAVECDRRADEGSPLLRGFGVITQANRLMGQGKWREAATLVAPLAGARVVALRRAALRARAHCFLYFGSAADLDETASALEAMRAATPMIDIARARSARFRKNVPEEIACLERAWAEYPTSGLAAAHLLYALNRGYRFEREQAVVASVLQMAPGDPPDCVHVVRALWRLRHFDEAKQMLLGGRKAFPYYAGWDGLEKELVVPRNLNPIQRLIRGLIALFNRAKK